MVDLNMKPSEERAQINTERIKAVILDMDGVVTDTAVTHATAWKRLFDQYLQDRANRYGEPFRPFEIETDYYQYVDGKPRYDGVRSFLESRGISLPYGRPDDDPDQETICGLGNRKNRYFRKSLETDGARPYESSIRFVQNLKSMGVGVAIISASRNAEAVLRAADALDIFDVKVDGVDSAELEIKGKPDPAIFLEAAKRLGVRPHDAAIVEDALAGVEAGRRGGFGAVIAVDRVGQAEEFKKRGATSVVRDLSELQVVSPPAPPEKPRPGDLPSALDRKDEIFRVLRKGSPAIFLDYDGTLTPIVQDPAEAVLSAKTKEVIERLADHFTVAVISGRDADDVREMVGISELIYAGSHGLDIIGPGETYRDQTMGREFLPALDRAQERLAEVIGDIPGARVERKRFAIAVHYRGMDESYLNELEARVDDVVSAEPELRKTTGKKIFELRPDIDWDKGKALLSLMHRLYLDSSKAIPLYLGDDVTDEDAFRAIRNRGIGIYVGTADVETLARYCLQDTDEVTRFLADLLTLEEKGTLADVWTLRYEGFDPGEEGLRETLCTLGNGYFATRGAAAECRADGVHYPGTYVAGVFNRLETEIAGQVIQNESMVNVPNWLPLCFRLPDGSWFDIENVEVLEHRLQLDMQRGVLGRMFRFADEQGRRTRVFQRRFVHMADPHLAGMEMTVTAENWSGPMEFRSMLDGQVINDGVARYRDLNRKHLVPVEEGKVNDDTVYLQVETSQSHIRIAEAARTRVFQDSELLEVERSLISEPGLIGQQFELHLDEGRPLIIEKIISLYTSRDNAISECGLEARKKLGLAGSFEALLERHILSWHHLWDRCRIIIEDSPRTALILHLHIFHLLQTVSPDTIDLDVGVPCRGLHGEAYRGHILWDELFIFPFLNLRIPDITRSLLRYRYRRLPEARRLAMEAGYQGAMYPWQSGSNGEEESQKLHLNPKSGRWIPDHSNLQRHINSAIAFNVWSYYQATHDLDFLMYYGAEMVFEIARFWHDIAEYDHSVDRYEIRGVMGPDEYHEGYPDAKEPGLNNNAYTNVMAVWVICRALEIVDLLPGERLKALSEKIGLTREELDRWDDISRKMKIAFHADGIISQFEGYGDLEEFDWEAYRKKYQDIQRLDRILEAEGDSPNCYKLSKQADVLMLFYLLSAEELEELFSRLGYEFDRDMIPRNIEYYMKRTAHGSTLSRVVHSWVLARSQRELSWHLFKEALESDISDVQGGTTAEGIHLGAMAGTVDLLQRCYTGLETRGDMLRLNPFLPNDLRSIQFEIVYRQHRLKLRVANDSVEVYTEPRAAGPVTIAYRDQVLELEPGESAELPSLRDR